MSAFECTGSPQPGLPGTPAAGPAPCPPGFLARLGAKLRAICASPRSRRAAQGLQSLSDWQLKDIGMHRSEVVWYRHGGTSAHPTRIRHAQD